MTPRSLAAAGAAVLHCLAGWGEAEPVRWVLAASQLEWRQQVVRSAEELAALRLGGGLAQAARAGGRAAHAAHAAPLLPLLEHGTLRLTQPHAVVRHVARCAGLCGGGAEEQARVDSAAEIVRELRRPLAALPFVPEAEQEEHMRRALAEGVGDQMQMLEESINAQRQQQGGRDDSGVAGASLSYADILVAEAVDAYDATLSAGALCGWPALLALRNRVRAMPQIAAYLASDLRYPCPRGAAGAEYVKQYDALMGAAIVHNSSSV